MIQDKIHALECQLTDIQCQMRLYNAIHQDYVIGHEPAINIRTDAVYEFFCERHPEIEVSQQKFTRILRETLNLKTVQGWVDGKRGSFYDCT